MEKDKYEKLIKKYENLYMENIKKINNLSQKERYCHLQELETRMTFAMGLSLIPFIIGTFVFIAIINNINPNYFRVIFLGPIAICFLIVEPIFFLRRKKKYPEFKNFINNKTKSELYEEKVRLIAKYRCLKSYNKIYLKVIEYYNSKIKLIDEIEEEYTIEKKQSENKSDISILHKQLEKYEEELTETVKRNIVIESFRRFLSKDFFQQILMGMMAGLGGMMYWNLPYLANNSADNPNYVPPSLLEMLTPMIVCILIPIIYNIFLRKYLKRIFDKFNDELKVKIPSKTQYYELISDGENNREGIKNQIYATLLEIDKLE